MGFRLGYLTSRSRHRGWGWRPELGVGVGSTSELQVGGGRGGGGRSRGRGQLVGGGPGVRIRRDDHWRADYRSAGGSTGRTSGSFFSSAFVPLVSCSSVFASAVFAFAVFCSLGSVCGHGAHRSRRRSSFACGQYFSALHAHEPCTCTAATLGVHCAAFALCFHYVLTCCRQVLAGSLP